MKKTSALPRMTETFDPHNGSMAIAISRSSNPAFFATKHRAQMRAAKTTDAKEANTIRIIGAVQSLVSGFM